jgi:CheY-like chemotaxis protein
VLMDQGYAVLEAGSGREAVRLLEQAQTLDVLVTDYAMPGMTGLEVVAVAHQRRPALPVLLITGYADPPAERRRDWPAMVLHKPFRPGDLVARIQALLKPAGPPERAMWSRSSGSDRASAQPVLVPPRDYRASRSAPPTPPLTDRGHPREVG